MDLDIEMARFRERVAQDMYAAVTGSNVTEPPRSITAAAVIAAMDRVRRDLGPAPPPLKIQESEYAMRDGGPARAYPKRKAKSVSHWRRMNKKWLKRYGIRRVPCMYRLDTSFATGKPGITLLVHPTLAAKLYAAIAAGSVK